MNDELEDKDLAELLKQIPAPAHLEPERRAAIFAALPKDEDVGRRSRRSRSTMLALVVSFAATITLMVLFGGLLIPNFLTKRSFESRCVNIPVPCEIALPDSSVDFSVDVEEPCSYASASVAAPAKPQASEVFYRRRPSSAPRASAVALEQEATKALDEPALVAGRSAFGVNRADGVENFSKRKESGLPFAGGAMAPSAETKPTGSVNLYGSRSASQSPAAREDVKMARDATAGKALGIGTLTESSSSDFDVPQAGVVASPASTPPPPMSPVMMSSSPLTKSPIIMKGIVAARPPKPRAGKALRYAEGVDTGVPSDDGRGAGETLNRDSVALREKNISGEIAAESQKADMAFKLGDEKLSARRLREVKNNRILGIQNGGRDEALAMQKPEQQLAAKSAEQKQEEVVGYDYAAGDVSELEYSVRDNVVVISQRPAPKEELVVEENELIEEEAETIDFGPFSLIPTVEHPLSTFGLDTDTAGYLRSAALIDAGVRPDPSMIRQEEFINAFEYGDEAPSEAAFRIYLEGAYSPFRPENNLLRVGIKGRRLGREEQRPLMLTILLDASGSMETHERMGLAQKAILALLTKLSARDNVVLLTCSDKTREIFTMTGWGTESVLESAQKALDEIRCQGATDLEDGIIKAYEKAAASFDPQGENRVVILSDGIANLGNVNSEDILTKVSVFRGRGIRCSVIGVGHSTYNDKFLEAMANRGDGQYNFLDSEKSINENFVNDLENSFNTIASDVKIQVEWNPKAIDAYRSHGYDSRALKDEEFRDDTVDAGEVGSGQGVSVVYEMKLMEKLKPTDILGTVHIRYRRTDTGEVEEIEKAITVENVSKVFDQMRPSFRLACAVAEFATVLKHTPPEAQGQALAKVELTAELVAQEMNYYTPAKAFADTVKKLIGIGL